MNARERTRALLTGQPSDRMGHADKIWWEAEKVWQEQGHLQKINPQTGKAEPVSFVDYYDQDMTECWPINTMPLIGFRQVISETDEWIITKDGAGASFKNWKHKSGTPEHIAFEMESFDIWRDKYRPHLLGLQPERCACAAFSDMLAGAHRKGKSAVTGSLFVWELLRSSLGDICMFETLLDDPDWIHDFNRVYTDLFKTHYRYLFEQCGVPDTVWLYDDLAYKQGPFCSPDTLRELFLPYYQEIVAFIHSYSIPVILHSCGNVERLLPMITEFGVDGLNPMEVKAGCDVVRFAEAYGDKLAFVGGLDVRLLEDGDLSAIKKEILRITDVMRRLKVGYFFGTDHSVSPNVAFETYDYAVQVFRDNMYY